MRFAITIALGLLAASLWAAPTNPVDVEKGGTGLLGVNAANVTASLTIPATNAYAVYNVDASGGASGAIDITLPDATTHAGHVYTLRKVDLSQMRIDILPASGQTINGMASFALRAPGEEVRLASNGTVWTARSSVTERIPGGHNLDMGLLRFRQSLGAVGKTPAGTGLGGVDVLVYGDSIAEGGESSNAMWHTWAHLLKVKLQDALNPPGVLGGYGYLPAMHGPSNGTASWAGLTDGYYFGVSNQANYLLTGRKVTTANSGFSGNASYGTKGQVTWVRNGDQLQWVFDGAHPEAMARRWGITSVEVIGSNVNNTYGGPKWDVFSDDGTVFPNAKAYGTGFLYGEYSPISQTNIQHGRRWATASGLNPTSRYVLQLTGPTTVFSNTDLIAYNGDEACGIRVHGLGYWGQTVTSLYGYTGWLDAMDTWGSGPGSTDANSNARTGAVNGKLYIFNFITNDAFVQGEANIATFKTNYAAVIDRVLALPTKPSVLLLIPPRGGSATATVYRLYANAIKEMAEARDNVAVLDLWEYTGWADGVQAGRVTELGWYLDATHYSDTAQEAWAGILFDALLQGRPVGRSDNRLAKAVIDVQDFGAIPNDGKDDYTALAAAIKALEAQKGRGTLLFPPGTYDILRCIGGTGTGEPAAGTQADLTIDNCQNFTVSGYGAKIEMAGNFTRAQGTKEPLTPLRFETCSDFVVEGLEVDGNVQDMAQSAGTSGSSEPDWANTANTGTLAWVVDNSVIHWVNTGVAASGEAAWAGTTSYTVGSAIAGNSMRWVAVSTMAEPLTGHGVYTKACIRYTLRDLYLHHSAADGIYLGGSSAVIDRDVLVQNVRSWFNARQGMSIIQARGVLVQGGSYNYTGYTGGTDAVATDASTATPAFAAIDTTYGFHSPGSGIDFEPNSATMTDGNKPGNVTLIGVTMRENVGPQFIAGTYDKCENVLLDGCTIDQGPNSFYRNSVRLFVPNGIIQNSYLNVQNAVITFNNAAVSTTFRNNRVLSNYNGVLCYQGAGRVLIENNRFEGTHTVAATTTFPRVDDDDAIFRNNIVVIPAAALSGANKNISAIRACRSENNRFETALAAGSYHFYVDYAGSTVKDDIFASAYIRPAQNATGTFTLASPFSHNAPTGSIARLPAIDDTGSGTLIRLVANETQAAGDVVYIDSTGQAALADADAATTAPAVAMATAATTADAEATYLLKGVMRNDGWNWTTLGGYIYLSTDGTTGNNLTQTAPSGTGDQIQVLGIALSADTMLFDPQTVMVEHT